MEFDYRKSCKYKSQKVNPVFLQKASKFAVYICGILLFISVFLVGIEVFLRKFFLISMGGVDEISGYILGICISWSLAYVLYEKMHIRIDILYRKMPIRIKAFLNMLSMLFTMLFTAFIAYYAFLVFYTSAYKHSTANTPLGTPLWIPQSFWFFGFLFFLVVIFVLFLKSIKAFIKKEDDENLGIGEEV